LPCLYDEVIENMRMRFRDVVRWCTSNKGWFTLSYLLDWLICGALLILNVAFSQYLWAPNDRYLPDNFQELQFPDTAEIIPTWLVVLIAMFLPVALFVVFQIALHSLHDLHHALLGLFEALVFNQVFTNSMQYMAGKYTPDWYARVRNGTPSVILAGRLSFPSWNASTSFTALSYFSLYLAGKLGLFRKNSGHTWKAVVVLVPVFGATLVSVTATLDYHSGFDDVIAGALLGLCLAMFFYSCNFHALSSNNSHLPLTRNVPDDYDGDEQASSKLNYRRAKDEEEEEKF